MLLREPWRRVNCDCPGTVWYPSITSYEQTVEFHHHLFPESRRSCHSLQHSSCSYWGMHRSVCFLFCFRSFSVTRANKRTHRNWDVTIRRKITIFRRASACRGGVVHLVFFYIFSYCAFLLPETRTGGQGLIFFLLGKEANDPKAVHASGTGAEKSSTYRQVRAHGSE